MQPGVVFGKEYAHAGMRVIPADQLLAGIAFLQLFIESDLGILREGQVGAAVAGMRSGQDGLDDDEMLAGGFVCTPFPDQPAADLVLQIAARMSAKAYIGPLGDEDRNSRVQVIFFEHRAPAPGMPGRDVRAERPGWFGGQDMDGRVGHSW